MKRGAVVGSLFLLPTLIACTAERSGQAPSKAGGESVLSAKSMVGLTSAVACSLDDQSKFERPAGEPVDLERENLPRGVFLATQAEVLIEKKAEGGTAAARVIVREEVVGKGGEIVCAEGLDRLGAEFEMVLSGLVKFETTEKPEGAGFVTRQFFFFQDKDGYGVVLSNPKRPSGRAPIDLRKLLRASPAAPQLYRTGDHTYTLRYSRERDGVRGQLVIQLEVF